MAFCADALRSNIIPVSQLTGLCEPPPGKISRFGLHTPNAPNYQFSKTCTSDRAERGVLALRPELADASPSRRDSHGEPCGFLFGTSDLSADGPATTKRSSRPTRRSGLTSRGLPQGKVRVYSTARTCQPPHDFFSPRFTRAYSSKKAAPTRRGELGSEEKRRVALPRSPRGDSRGGAVYARVRVCQAAF